MKPKLLVLQGKRNFDILTYVESDAVREYFNVYKASEIVDNPDLVYCQAYGPLYTELMKCKAPYLIHVGGSPWLELRDRRLHEAIEIMKRARAIVCNSKFLQDLFIGHGMTNAIRLPDGLWGLDHTPIGPMPTRFKPKADYQIKERPIVCMSINLMHNSVKENKWRGIPIFLEAVKSIASKHGVYFLCAGRGERKFPLLDEWREKYNFHFHPSHHLDDSTDKWPEILRTADVFVHPSTFDCWPRSVADAMCAAVPGFIFSSCGTGEVVESYLQASPANAKEIAEKIEALLFTPLLRLENGKKARAEAVKRTNQHRGDYVRLLKTLIERKGK